MHEGSAIGELGMHFYSKKACYYVLFKEDISGGGINMGEGVGFIWSFRG